MTSMKSKQYLKLRDKWYKKLEKSGFEDIEDVNSQNEMLHRWHDHWFRSRMTPEQFQAKQQYFENCAWFLEHHCFDTSLEKRVWACHADGLSLSQTATKLKISKSRCYLIVKKLKGIMNAD